MKKSTTDTPKRATGQTEPNPAGPGTCSGEFLCELTGLTDRRHRQLAKDGFFPPPIRGVYLRDDAIKGIFRHYRELDQRKRKAKELIDEEKHRKLKWENDEADGRLTDTEKLSEQVAASLIAFRDQIYAKLEDEAPTAMSTLDVPSARIIGRRLADKLIVKIQETFKQWAV